MCIENKKKTSFQWLRWSASRKSWKCAMLLSWWLDEKRVPALLLNILLLYCCCYGAFSWMKRQANRSNREKKVHTISLYRNFRTLQSICSVCWVELSLGYEIVVVFFLLSFFAVGYFACLFFVLFAIVQALVDMLLPRFSQTICMTFGIWYGLVFIRRKLSSEQRQAYRR